MMGLAPTCTGFTGRPRTALRSSTIRAPKGLSPRGRIRTCGLLLPKQARLSPTPLGDIQLGSRGSNPDFLVNSQARYRYNTPQFRAPGGSRTRTPCLGSRQAAATSQVLVFSSLDTLFYCGVR